VFNADGKTTPSVTISYLLLVTNY